MHTLQFCCLHFCLATLICPCSCLSSAGSEAFLRKTSSAIAPETDIEKPPDSVLSVRASKELVASPQESVYPADASPQTAIYAETQDDFPEYLASLSTHVLGDDSLYSVPFLAGVGYDIYRIPASIVHPATGELLVFAEGREDAKDEGPVDIVCRTSKDQGRTWSRLIKVAKSSIFDSNTTIGNPVPIADHKEGAVRLILAVNNTRIMVTVSSDGYTWTQPRELTNSLKREGWGWMATGPGHGLTTHDGTLIVPFNRALAKHVETLTLESSQENTPWYDARGAGAISSMGTLHVQGTRKEEDYWVKNFSSGDLKSLSFGNAGVFIHQPGRGWSIGGLTVLGSNENAVVEVEPSDSEPSDLLMSFRRHGVVDPNHPYCRNFARSRNNGYDWSQPWIPIVKGEKEPYCLPDPGCEASLLVLPRNNGCPSSRELIVSSGPAAEITTDDFHKNRGNLTLWVSADQAQTFTKAAQLSRTVGTGGYSDLVKLGSPDPCVDNVGVLFEAVPGMQNGGTIAFARVSIDHRSGSTSGDDDTIANSNGM